MRAAVHLAYGDAPARCPACRTSDELRMRWGCDSKAPAPVFSRTCPRCSGADMECERCNGSGVDVVYRCPTSQIGPNAMNVMHAYQWSEKGVLPGPGGWTDQSAILLDAFSVIGSERYCIAESERRSREAKAKVK